MALAKDHKLLIEEIEEQLAGQRPAVVVIDTLNRTLRNLKGSNDDMPKIIAAADAIRQRFKCTVIIVHHFGYDETHPRGPTSLPAAADVIIAVAKDATGLITVTVQEMRDDEPPPPFACRLERWQVGVNRKGAKIY